MIFIFKKNSFLHIFYGKLGKNKNHKRLKTKKLSQKIIKMRTKKKILKTLKKMIGNQAIQSLQQNKLKLQLLLLLKLERTKQVIVVLPNLKSKEKITNNLITRQTQVL